ncbi:hypothetical protein LZ575_10830 [Antarcticibacterium sp. 1MA-6-2]|nr:hypothetical protein [Antarcticibacterium sp. 1MA-6-2]UJH92858.1 hypothetical protein LZ575_10830 [Antarcticibacterium sp. 1MA-6-2]
MSTHNSHHWQNSHPWENVKSSVEENTWSDYLLVFVFILFLIFLGVIAG